MNARRIASLLGHAGRYQRNARAAYRDIEMYRRDPGWPRFVAWEITKLQAWQRDNNRKARKSMYRAMRLMKEME